MEKIFKKIPFNEVSSAPECAGLYAWYAQPSLGKADLKDFFDADGIINNLGQERTKQALSKHTSKFDPLPKPLKSYSPFGGIWKGSLINTGQSNIKKIILSQKSYDEKSIEHKIIKSTKNQKNREKLLEILENAHPLIASPIYIGMSNNLRRRLTQHTATFISTKEKIKNLDNYLEILKKNIDRKTSTFAERAIAAEFSSDDLFAVILPIDEEERGEDHDEIIESAEWILNRWYKPILGRR